MDGNLAQELRFGRVFTIENHVGRLVETTIASPVDISEIDAFRARIRAIFGKLQGRRGVLVTDLLGATTFPTEIADGFLAIMRSDNPMVERSAFLISGSAIFTLQIERLIREASSPIRRTFRDARALHEWVSELLDEDEQLQAARFLRLP